MRRKWGTAAHWVLLSAIAPSASTFESFSPTCHRENIPLKELNLTFVNDFEYFLRKEKKCRTNIVWGYMIVLKHIISIARNTGLLLFNPFAGYINSPESVDSGYLTEEEIQTLIEASMKNKTYELVRDLFVFSVFTGLSYANVKKLTTDNLQTFFDGTCGLLPAGAKPTPTPISGCWTFPNE